MKLGLDAIGAENLVSQLSRIGTRDIPFAVRNAYTSTAFGIRDEIQTEMRRVFDRPTAFTLRSTLVRHPAGKGLFSSDGTIAEVFIRDDADKGTAPEVYLAPHVFGGPRVATRTEKRLRRSGILGPSMFMVPARNSIAVDARSGNLRTGTIVRMLSSLGALGDVGANATRLHRGTKSRYPEQFFVIDRPGSNLAEGIWRKRGNRIDPVVIFVPTPHYHKRFDFFGVAEQIGRRLLPAKLEETIRWILDHPYR